MLIITKKMADDVATILTIHCENCLKAHGVKPKKSIVNQYHHNMVVLFTNKKVKKRKEVK